MGKYKDRSASGEFHGWGALLFCEALDSSGIAGNVIW